MRFTAKECLGLLTITFLAVPLLARPETRTFEANWIANQATTVGTTQIQPGDYTLKVRENDSTMDVTRNGKLVAQVPCHWIQLPKKAANTEVDTNNNRIAQVEFAGKTEAVQVR